MVPFDMLTRFMHGKWILMISIVFKIDFDHFGGSGCMLMVVRNRKKNKNRILLHYKCSMHCEPILTCLWSRKNDTKNPDWKLHVSDVVHMNSKWQRMSNQKKLNTKEKKKRKKTCCPRVTRPSVARKQDVYVNIFNNK